MKPDAQESFRAVLPNLFSAAAHILEQLTRRHTAFMALNLYTTMYNMYYIIYTFYIHTYSF